MDLVRAALLLSFWSSSPRRKCSRQGSYWLSVALSEARQIAARYRICPKGFGQDGRIVKCLLWSCIIRETILTLGHRGTNLMEPHLIDVPPLEIDDLDDALSYSREHERETKRILGGMLVSFAELVSLSSRFRPLRPSAVTSRPASASGPNVLEYLINLERASMQLTTWRHRFPCEFSGVAAFRRPSDFPIAAYHQIIMMMIYEYTPLSTTFQHNTNIISLGLYSSHSISHTL